jgi:hypothetical protein
MDEDVQCELKRLAKRLPPGQVKNEFVLRHMERHPLFHSIQGKKLYRSKFKPEFGGFILGKWRTLTFECTRPQRKGKTTLDLKKAALRELVDSIPDGDVTDKRVLDKIVHHRDWETWHKGAQIFKGSARGGPALFSERDGEILEIGIDCIARGELGLKQGKSQNTKVQLAMRGAADAQIQAFRVSNNVPRTGWQVDHAGRGFAALKKEWLDLNGLDSDYLDTYHDKGRGVRLFADDALNQSFASYHMEHAVLEAVTEEEHRRRTRERRLLFINQQ